MRSLIWLSLFLVSTGLQVDQIATKFLPFSTLDPKKDPIPFAVSWLIVLLFGGLSLFDFKKLLRIFAASKIRLFKDFVDGKIEKDVFKEFLQNNE